MSDSPALDCLRTACEQLAEKNTSLRQWRVAQDGVNLSVFLQWLDHEATVLIRGPEDPKSFGRTASFTFAIQMDEATQLMSHELEVGLGLFIEAVRKVDAGNIPLPQPHPQWEPGAGPPSAEPASDEPESDEPESDEPKSDEPEVPMHVVSNPQPRGSHSVDKEDWISHEADRAHAENQEALNWAIYCAIHCLDADPYPHANLLGPRANNTHEAAHQYLVQHLSSGFSLSEFEGRFGMRPSELCPEKFQLLRAFEAIVVEGDQVRSTINHPARLAVYQTFLYSPAVRAALEEKYVKGFDGRLEHIHQLMAKFS